MKTFSTSIVRSRWLTTLLGVLLLGLVVWFFGPLLAVGITRPLETELARGGVIGACLLAWLVWNLTHVWHARKRDKALVDGVAAEQVDPSEAASAEEVALLGGRLREALQALKRAKLGARSGRYLYQLPWYLFIGPPGAGKTTALINCGLRFPLGRYVRPGRDARRRRHPQLRLVVHRPGGADRHGRPLHHAGQRRPRWTALAGWASWAC